LHAIFHSGSESSTLFSLSGAKVPGGESSMERKFQGTKVPLMELSLPGAKVRGNESSSYLYVCMVSYVCCKRIGHCLQPDTRALEAFYMRCQWQILGVWWFDFIRNDKTALSTGLLPITDLIAKRWRSTIFSHRPSVGGCSSQPSLMLPHRCITRSTTASFIEM